MNVIKDSSKLCGICGDKAHGYNFNAITCESCKAFFRRNALRKKEFKCPFDGNCKIDSVTRKFCKKCRLKKCFDIGMKKEWILSDEEKLSLRSKIAENRKKRTSVSKVGKVADSTTSSYNFPNVVQLIQNSYTTNNDRISEIGCYSRDPNDPFSPIGITSSVAHTTSDSSIHSNSSSNCGLNKVQTSDNYRPNCDSLSINAAIDSHCFLSAPKAQYLPMEVINSERSNSSEVFSNRCQVITDGSIESIKNSCIETLTTFGNITKIGETGHNLETIGNYKSDEIPDNVYQKTIELEFASIPIKEMFNNLSQEEFNRYENQRVEELSKATEHLNWFKTHPGEAFNFTSEFSHLLDATKVLATRCDRSIRRLVIMSKKIEAFKNLCQHDQIALMKAGCFEILIQRSVITYNQENEYWPIVVDDHMNAAKLKLDLFKQAKGNLYEAHKKFMQGFKQDWIEWDLDYRVLDLLTAIILFTPDRANIIHREIIKLEQQTYMYLLQRYLLSKNRSKCEAKLVFLKLMSKLEDLHVLHDKHVSIYLEVDPQDVGPLLLEILDLNPHTNTLQML